jgi:hypothetical protein
MGLHWMTVSRYVEQVYQELGLDRREALERALCAYPHCYIDFMSDARTRITHPYSELMREVLILSC